MKTYGLTHLYLINLGREITLKLHVEPVSIDLSAVAVELLRTEQQAMSLERIPTVSKNYFEDNISDYERRKNKEIWSVINVKDLTVIDLGVGESTKRLIDLGARVIAIDRDANKLKKYKNPSVQLIKCDITDLPFNSRIANLAVFYFTLHEIDPIMHKEVISTIRRISSKIMVVEPSPKGCSAYRRYAKLWRRAMHSIGKFEDYRDISYWKELIENCGFKIVVLKKIKQNMVIPSKVLEEIVQTTIKEWEKMSVESRYIKELNEFLEYAKKNGMKWSDLIVIIGESR